MYRINSSCNLCYRSKPLLTSTLNFSNSHIIVELGIFMRRMWNNLIRVIDVIVDMGLPIRHDLVRVEFISEYLWFKTTNEMIMRIWRR